MTARSWAPRARRLAPLGAVVLALLSAGTGCLGTYGDDELCHWTLPECAELDFDHDGVPNGADKCPADPSCGPFCDGLVGPAGYVCIEPGVFTMGSPPYEAGRSVYGDETQHRVTLTRAFWMKATEVTQGEYEALMGENPSYFAWIGAALPVDSVNWYEAVAYCNALSVQQGLSSCYAVSGEQVTFTGTGCKGYRMPTEAEWEYAARAGTMGARHGDLETVAWCYPTANGLQPTAQKQPNAWGLYDMLGNIGEWCYDWFDAYEAAPATDPVGPASGSCRVIRGGNWSRHPDYVRSAARSCSAPSFEGDWFVGLRVVRSLP